MGTFSNVLMPELEHADGSSYRVSVETSMRGLAGLNVAGLKPESDEEANSQGADLTAAECRSLAQMLLAAAILVEETEAMPRD